ncbi:hypothetical protein Adt_36612 [Abeliophyllum distichum]|uniref:Uncharacterized protein n=1 Tax=Abeliophyllum distichum TaxID=126358 RepID=A0ABD1QIG7_9LAMI
MVTDSEDDSNFVDSENDNDEDDDLAYEQNVTNDIQIEVEGRVSEGAKDIENEGKLTPKRGSTSASNQAHKPESVLKFMPTPRVDMRHADLNMLSGPSASLFVPEENSKWNIEAPVIITEEVDISTMVDELERLNSEEATRNRAERARTKTKEYEYNTSSSVPEENSKWNTEAHVIIIE